MGRTGPAAMDVRGRPPGILFRSSNGLAPSTFVSRLMYSPLTAGFGLLFVSASIASAQRPASPISFTPFIGAVLPVGARADFLSTGYTIGGAWDYRAPRARVLGGRIEAGYSSLRARGSSSGGSLNHTDLGVNLNGVLWAPLPAPGTLLPYVTGGLTFARLEDRVTSGTIAYSGARNRFGFNVGGGAYVVAGVLPVRIDVRYKRVESDGVRYQVLPVTIGLRL